MVTSIASNTLSYLLTSALYVSVGLGLAAIVNRYLPSSSTKPRVEIPAFTPPIHDFSEKKSTSVFANVFQEPDTLKIEQIQSEMEAFLQEIEGKVLQDNNLYNCGPFYLYGKELKFMAESLAVSYDPSIIYSHTLQTALTDDPVDEKMQAEMRGRMVSSFAVSLRDSEGNPIFRYVKTSLPYYRIYTSSTPNLSENQLDQEQFVYGSEIKEEAYISEMKRIFLHFFGEAKANNDNTVVIPGFGMETSIPEKLRPQAQKYFEKALQEAIDSEGEHFDEIIHTDPAKEKSLDVTHSKAKQGSKVALLHLEGSDEIELFTTLPVGQNPACNPAIGDKSTYYRLDK
ncbi:MAG: hypothetical protein K940chlam6_01570 [Chlamydiae bacterium]|nr:hypothetical protein [Chlamydiota bacterium]